MARVLVVVVAALLLASSAGCGRTAREDHASAMGGHIGAPSPHAGASAGGSQAASDPGGADGGVGSVPSEVLAGAGGESAIEPPSECDVVVPRDVADLETAIASVTPPALICLEAGVFKPGGNAPLAMRDGISLRGLSRHDSILCSSVDVSAAQTLGLTLENLVIAGAVRGQTAVTLTLRAVTVNGGHADCVANPSGAAVELRFVDPERVLTLTVEDALFSGPGVLVASADQHSAMRMEVMIRRSACFAHQCWDLARFDLGQLTADSRVSIAIDNNIVQHSVLQAFALYGQLPPPIEGNSSSVRIANNTIYTADDLNYGIFVADDFGATVVVANNAVGNLMTPIVGPVVEFSNVVASSGAAAWFVDAAGGNFAPSDDSPLRGAADYDYLPGEDFFGNPRISNVVGALE